MKKWLRFFFGTPQRFVVTTLTLIAAIVTVQLFPGFLRNGLEGLVNELSPLVGSVLVILIVLAGLKIITGIGRGGKK